MSGRLLRWLLSLWPRSSRSVPRLTIVRHHRVYDDHERPLYRLGVSASVLESQLRALSVAGLAPLTVSEGLARLAESRTGHWVAMSFDDGYADNVSRALPLLKAAGARATFYLTAGWIDARRPAWWDELAYALEHARVPECRWTSDQGRVVSLRLATPRDRADSLRKLLPEMRVPTEARARSLERLREATAAAGEARCEFADWSEAARLLEAGMEIGAHTLTHPHLSLLDPAGQRREIEGSIRLIESRLGSPPTGFAYPGGDLDERSVAIVRDARLAHAVTTSRGDVTPGADRLRLPRRGLSEGACLGPTGVFSTRLTLAEVRGAFDGLRSRVEAAA